MSHEGETDRALVTRLARRGDPGAFEALYLRHAQALHDTAVRIAGDDDLAADAVHDAWVRAVEGLHRFEARSTFRTWLTGILVNCIRERWRESRREVGADGIADSVEAAPLSGSEIESLDLDHAMASLAPGFRQVLVLHDVEGFTHEEIADMLGIAAGTSKSQLARARGRMRELLTHGAIRKLP